VFDLTLVRNSANARRVYDGVVAQASYRYKRVWVQGNYTLSKTWGNFNGENVNSGPIRATIETFPEYRQESWNYPEGYNPGDQRHKTRLAANFSLPLPEASGRWDVGVLQRADSGPAVDVNGSIDTRPYVTNPGYTTPIGSVAYYFIPRGDFRWDPIFSTALALNWSKRLGVAKTEVFFRGVLTNIFNNSGLISGDISVLTRLNNTKYAAFNPFTTQPVQGVNWDYSPTFGQASASSDYQISRQFSFSFGVRF